jgi:hypothetical protein
MAVWESVHGAAAFRPCLPDDWQADRGRGTPGSDERREQRVLGSVARLRKNPAWQGGC